MTLELTDNLNDLKAGDMLFAHNTKSYWLVLGVKPDKPDMVSQDRLITRKRLEHPESADY